MRTLPMLLLAYAFAFTAAAQDHEQDNCTATLGNVAGKLSEVVVFCGTPTSVRAPKGVNGDPVFINFGGAFPQPAFVVVVWGSVAGEERKHLVKRYTDKPLRITGLVKERKGEPEIELKALADIRVE